MSKAAVVAAASILAVGVFAIAVTAPPAMAEWCLHSSGKKKVPCTQAQLMRKQNSSSKATGTGNINLRVRGYRGTGR